MGRLVGVHLTQSPEKVHFCRTTDTFATLRLCGFNFCFSFVAVLMICWWGSGELHGLGLNTCFGRHGREWRRSNFGWKLAGFGGLEMSAGLLLTHLVLHQSNACKQCIFSHTFYIIEHFCIKVYHLYRTNSIRFLYVLYSKSMFVGTYFWMNLESLCSSAEQLQLCIIKL